MNLLFIGTTDILGGAAKISWDLKNALEKQGHATSMFVADKRSKDPSVKVIPRQKWRKYLGFMLATDDLLSSDWILKTLEYKNADVVHCHNLHGRYFNLSTLQKMSVEKPVIWTLHDEWAITPHCVCTFEGKEMRSGFFMCPDKNTPLRILWDNTRYLSWRKNSIYKRSKLHIVTPSQWLKERVEKTILNFQDVRLIHNGIDTDGFKMSAKNINKKEDVALYYSASDMLLFTSIAENFPLVILEAMSCGLPLVSFDVGGVKEAVIHKENGYISTYKDTRSLIEGIEYILNLNANELEAMSESSIKRIQNHFTSTIMINNYLNLYLELLRQ